MAVRVQLSADELTAALAPFGAGGVRRAQGLPAGSINTGYRVEAAAGTFFARLATGREEAAVELEAELLEFLRGGGLPVVPPRRTAGGRPAVALRGGWLSLFPWVAGESLSPEAVGERQLWELGRILGRLHRIGAGFSRRRANPFGAETVEGWFQELSASRGGGEAEVAAALPLVRRALDLGATLPAQGEAWIHADAFRDNVLWVGDRVSALLDFEMACTAPPALDLAVAMLDWTWEAQRFSPGRVRPLLEGWRNAVGRGLPLGADALRASLLFAAARFTLSRLRDFHFSPLPESALVRKDWREMRARLEAALALGQRELEGLVAAAG